MVNAHSLLRPSFEPICNFSLICTDLKNSSLANPYNDFLPLCGKSRGTGKNRCDYRYTGAKRWDSGSKYDIQSNYEIKLDNVKCTRGEWRSCSYSESHNCDHSEDVFLSCSGEFICLSENQ